MTDQDEALPVLFSKHMTRLLTELVAEIKTCREEIQAVRDLQKDVLKVAEEAVRLHDEKRKGRKL